MKRPLIVRIDPKTFEVSVWKNCLQAGNGLGPDVTTAKPRCRQGQIEATARGVWRAAFGYYWFKVDPALPLPAELDRLVHRVRLIETLHNADWKSLPTEKLEKCAATLTKP